MQKKTVIALVLLVAAGLAVWYFFFRKPGQATAAKISLGPAGLGPLDTAAFNQMVAFVHANTDDAFLDWLLPSVDMTARGTNPDMPQSQDYYIGGKISKTGALLAEYARQVAPHIYDGGIALKNGMTAQQFNDGMYNIFYQLRSKLLIAS